VDEGEVLDNEEAGAAQAIALEASAILQAIAEADSSWQPNQAIDLNGSTWRPHLSQADGSAILYVHLSDRLRSFASTRLNMAFEGGVTVHVALPETRIYDEEVLRILARLDAHIHVIGTSGNVGHPERVLALLADRQVTLTPGARSTMTLDYLELCRHDASAHVKGRRFEALLAFLFSQVADFIVRERNFKSETEEIDIVVQQRATQGRAWAALMAPFILIEAKNRREGVSQEMTSAFLTKMQGKRGTVRLGFVCSTTTVSRDAITQELRFAAGDATVVFLDYEAIKAWMLR
jgi:hypothetical protein